MRAAVSRMGVPAYPQPRVIWRRPHKTYWKNPHFGLFFSSMANSSDTNVPVTVLLVSADLQDHTRFRGILNSTPDQLRVAASYAEAVRSLHRERPLVLICEASLPDGSWKDVLSHTCALPDAPPVIVTSTHADDRLWSEVLNLGGYDVLSKPLYDEEVRRVIGLAGRPSQPSLAARV